MKKILFLALGVTAILLACNKKELKRDYTKVTIQLTSDSMEVVGRSVYAYDDEYWDSRWEQDTILIDTTKAREVITTDGEGIAVFANVEYTNPNVFNPNVAKPQSNFRFVTQYRIDDSLVQKVHTVLVTKGNEIETPFDID